MQKRIAEAVKRAHLIYARERFTQLEEMATRTSPPEYRVDSETLLDHINLNKEAIEKSLAQSGFTLAALDPKNEATEAEMQKRLDAAVERARDKALPRRLPNYHP